LAAAVTLHEPATFLTDCLLAGLAWTLAWRLRPGHGSARWWKHTFTLTGVSALVGGTFHGFAPNVPSSVQSLWWLATLWVISGVSACLLLGLIAEIAPAGHRSFWRVAVVAKLVLALLAVAFRPDFVVVIVDYGVALTAWLLAALLVPRPWRGWMLAGIGLSVGAAIVQQSGWPRLPFFNHNDLYHLIQAIGLMAFFQGARRLGMSDKLGSL